MIKHNVVKDPDFVEIAEFQQSRGDSLFKEGFFNARKHFEADFDKRLPGLIQIAKNNRGADGFMDWGISSLKRSLRWLLDLDVRWPDVVEIFSQTAYDQWGHPS